MVNLIFSTICFSLSFGLIKAQLTSLPTEFVVFFRLFIATIIFLPFTKNIKSKKHIFAFFIGIIQFALMYFCFIKAFKYLQGNEVAILTTTTPIFVALWASFFGEKFKPIYILCILLSVLGAIIILWENISLSFIIKGILLMETSNCLFALGQILWKKFITDDSEKYIASAYLGASIFILPFLLISQNFDVLNVSFSQWFSLLYLGIIPTGLGFFLWNKGASKVNASTLAIMNNLKIPLGIFFALLLFNEQINILNFCIGGSIILFTILYLHKK